MTLPAQSLDLRRLPTTGLPTPRPHGLDATNPWIACTVADPAFFTASPGRLRRTCLLASQCRGRPSRTDGRRTVSVLEPLPSKPTSPSDSTEVATDDTPTRPSSTITVPRVSTSQPPPPPPFVPPQPSLGDRPVLWLDVGAVDLRHRLCNALDAQHVEVVLPPMPTADPERDGRYSRDQRAHRRQTWTERFAHNQCRPGTEPQIKIHGVPSAISDFLGLHRANQEAA